VELDDDDDDEEDNRILTASPLKIREAMEMT
jgi:hypothetical protein